MPVGQLAHRRLLAVDLGARFCGLAVRECRLAGAQAFGLLERSAARGAPPVRGWSTFDPDAGWALQRARRFGGGARERHATLAAALGAIVRERRIGGLVLGMPLLANGDRTAACAIVEEVAAALQKVWPGGPPILLWDESWSTRFAVGVSRSRTPHGRHATWTHSAAAVVVLEDVIAALRVHEARGPAGGARDTRLTDRYLV